MATLRNTAIGWHRINGDTNIARANRRAGRRSHDLIEAVTSSYTNTQSPCWRPFQRADLADVRAPDQPNKTAPSREQFRYGRNFC
jgi:hypothetical protein